MVGVPIVVDLVLLRKVVAEEKQAAIFSLRKQNHEKTNLRWFANKKNIYYMSNLDCEDIFYLITYKTIN